MSTVLENKRCVRFLEQYYSNKDISVEILEHRSLFAGIRTPVKYSNIKIFEYQFIRIIIALVKIHPTSSLHSFLDAEK